MVLWIDIYLKPEEDCKLNTANVTATKLRASSKLRRLGIRKLVFNHYGTKCILCGFTDDRALQIDHINDNGAEERKSLGGKSFSGYRFYEWLIKQGYPEGYQTLCANCNNIKQWNKNNGS